MSLRKFLGGKVEVRSLLVTDQPANRTEAQARIMSPSGELAVLCDGKMEVRHLAYAELRSGLARGNHFHKKRHEYFYVIAGEAEIHLKEMSSGDEATASVRVGDLVTIAPEIAHAFMPSDSGHGLEFAEEAFDPGDVYREQLVRNKD